ncbi:MAG: 50S ribosomal protein L29 [bacterium]|nr:50S ribosomal protein L29 [bacterium]
MKSDQKANLRQKTIDELSTLVDSLQKELALKKMEKAIGKLKQTHLIKDLYYKIALIKTIITEKQMTKE